jgi:thiol-disulfide isomerase/thioredoxin
MNYNLNIPTLILFYADWCGHCQRFIPIWKELKTKINTKECNIIEIESDETFIKKIKDLKAYPTIYYISTNLTTEYKDDRTIESILNFLEKNKN